MTLTKQRRLILATLITLALGVVVVVIAVRFQSLGTQPVAPTAPKSKPKAIEPPPPPDEPTRPIPSPGADSSCRVSWTFVVPTSGPSATPTPTGRPGPTATPTARPAATNTPVPGQPQATSAPRPTSIPTVAEQELPEAGGIGETIGLVVGGIGILLIGLLMLL